MSTKNSEYYPFRFCSDENESSLLLTNDMKWGIFEGLGYSGSGHDWTRVMSRLVDDKLPEVVATIDFDSEADMFCVRSNNLENLKKISALASSFYDDDEKMKELVSLYGQYGK